MPDPETHEQTWDSFHECRPLAGLSDLAMREMFAAAERRSYQPGEALIKQGDAADGLFIVLEGTAQAWLRSPNGDHWLGRFKKGDLVGEMALVTRETRTADVIAQSEVKALLVPTEAFDALAVRHLELGLLLTKLVADRLGTSIHDGFGNKRIEGFRILSCIGRGGMSVVYQAQDESSGEIVALKMMSYRLSYDAEALARFHKESSVHQSLEHENIARLKRLFPAYRTYFLVMELCEGMDLRRLLKLRRRLDESQTRAVLGQLACALEYVHGRGLVHRDLKPANVMITKTRQVKLTDFGLAVPAALPGDDETGAKEESVMGTPAFMAPEQLARGRIDPRTDVYALACLAFDLLAGRHLFTATNVFDLVQEKAGVQLPPAADIGDGISDEMYQFLNMALRVNPDERPSSAAALVKWAAPCDPPPEALSEGTSEDPTI